MNQYNPDAACPKCGGEDVASCYRKRLDASPYCERTYVGHTNETRGLACEHIERHCKRCHFEWPELTLDHVAKGEPLPLLRPDAPSGDKACRATLEVPTHVAEKRPATAEGTGVARLVNTRTRDLVFLVYTATCLFSWMACATFRQHAEQARAATAAVIEAPQRVESGATVTEALGAALTANIEKTDRLDGLITTKVGGNGDSVALWIALTLLGLGQIGDFVDRRRFHRKGAEAKGIVR